MCEQVSPPSSTSGSPSTSCCTTPPSTPTCTTPTPTQFPQHPQHANFTAQHQHQYQHPTRPQLTRMKSCLKASPTQSGTCSPVTTDGDGKRVAFREHGTEEVFEADEWDRTPAEVAHRLSYEDILELKLILRSLPRAEQPHDPTSRPGSVYLKHVPIPLLPLGTGVGTGVNSTYSSPSISVSPPWLNPHHISPPNFTLNAYMSNPNVSPPNPSASNHTPNPDPPIFIPRPRTHATPTSSLSPSPTSTNTNSTNARARTPVPPPPPPPPPPRAPFIGSNLPPPKRSFNFVALLDDTSASQTQGPTSPAPSPTSPVPKPTSPVPSSTSTSTSIAPTPTHTSPSTPTLTPTLNTALALALDADPYPSDTECSESTPSLTTTSTSSPSHSPTHSPMSASPAPSPTIYDHHHCGPHQSHFPWEDNFADGFAHMDGGEFADVYGGGGDGFVLNADVGDDVDAEPRRQGYNPYFPPVAAFHAKFPSLRAPQPTHTSMQTQAHTPTHTSTPTQKQAQAHHGPPISSFHVRFPNQPKHSAHKIGAAADTKMTLEAALETETKSKITLRAIPSPGLPAPSPLELGHAPSPLELGSGPSQPPKRTCRMPFLALVDETSSSVSSSGNAAGVSGGNSLVGAGAARNASVGASKAAGEGIIPPSLSRGVRA
ncbi:hypothetical protein BJ138DRAFT_773547 [Hygrophoropsis aurantiaca]|uniref:Uncharacterized protein n=1 Tax=Hygrophoropsis aurantiaca TaxID=72124 RepID=A0ACB7ZXL2_9AGAM|nr:hypothetical protein BJ138DRAFT_773547 [Hygrophoropsis aurantiaca]